MTSTKKRTLAACAAVLIALSLFGAAGAASATDTSPTITDTCVDGVPDRGKTTPARICFTVFQPAGADAAHRAPAVIHSHGWGGTRIKDPGFFAEYLDNGIGVISLDQRGHGQSTGSAYIQNPEFEGQDLLRVLDAIAVLPWIQLDRPGDPRLGTIGGSYGGAFQYLAALEQTRTTGRTVIDAMAPDSTWFDLNESLAPEGLVRTQGATILGTTGGTNLEPGAGYSLLIGSLTGKWPDGSFPGTIDMHDYIADNGAAWYTQQGLKLDVPMVIASGATDNLFPLQQGLKVWDEALTQKARKNSIFLSFNGGHALPSLQPLGISSTGDPCSVELGSDGFEEVVARFMLEELKGIDTGLAGRGELHLATAHGGCRTVDSVAPNTDIPVAGGLATELGTRVAKITDGPISVAGRTTVRADVTTGLPDSFAFYALAVGTSVSDARIVQNNMIPHRERQKVRGQEREFELPSVAVDVPPGESLFLLTTPIQDMFTGTSTLIKGSMRLDDITVSLPVVG